MRKFVYTKNGEPSYTVVPSDDIDLADNISVFEVPFSEDESYIYENTFYKNGQRFEREPRPTGWHEWDSTSESWLPNLDAAREAQRQQVAAELNARLYLPCNGFDADPVSRERISGMIARLQRGDGLPTSWLGWRDAANEMHWATDDAATVLAGLTELSRVIEDREQALLVASWAHKTAIAALEDIDAIIAYDVTQGWPT